MNIYLIFHLVLILRMIVDERRLLGRLIATLLFLGLGIIEGRVLVKVSAKVLGVHPIGQDRKDSAKARASDEVVSDLIIRVLVLQHAHHEVRDADADHLDAGGDTVGGAHSLVPDDHADRGPEAASDHTVAHTGNDEGGDLGVVAEDKVAVEGDHHADADGEEDHALADVVDEAAEEGDAGDGDKVDETGDHAVLVVEGALGAAVEGLVGVVTLLEVVDNDGHEGEDADVVERADDAEDPVDRRERDDVSPFDLLGLTDSWTKIAK